MCDMKKVYCVYVLLCVVCVLCVLVLCVCMCVCACVYVLLCVVCVWYVLCVESEYAMVHVGVHSAFQAGKSFSMNILFIKIALALVTG